MQLSTMRSEARLIFGEPDINKTHFDETQLTTWANEFYRFACVKLGSLPITERSYTIGTTIALNANTITVDNAKIYIRPSNQWRPLTIGDLKDLMNIDPNWENATVGEPAYLIRTGTFTARLYVPPNSANDGQLTSLKTFGLEMPTALSADADIPDLPANIQDLFPYWMAYKAFARLNDKDNALIQLQLVQGALKDQKNISIKFSSSRGWRWMTDNFIDPTGIFQE